MTIVEVVKKGCREAQPEVASDGSGSRMESQTRKKSKSLQLTLKSLNSVVGSVSTLSAHDPHAWILGEKHGAERPHDLKVREILAVVAHCPGRKSGTRCGIM